MKKHYYGVDFDKQRESLLKSEAAQIFITDIITKADAALDSLRSGPETACSYY